MIAKFTKLFPQIDNAIGGLFILVQRIFLRTPPLRAHRIRALAEVVAYLLEREPKTAADRFQIEHNRQQLREWKLSNDFIEIYSNLPHIYEHLADVRASGAFRLVKQ